MHLTGLIMAGKSMFYQLASILVLSVLCVACGNSKTKASQISPDKNLFGWVEGNCLVANNLVGLDSENAFVLSNEKLIDFTPIDINDEVAISRCPPLIRRRSNGVIDVSGVYNLTSPYSGDTSIVLIVLKKANFADKTLLSYLEGLERVTCTTSESVVYSVIRKSDNVIIWQNRDQLGYDVDATCPEDLQYLD